jgi:deazaflavin-dependent oxidoreductase (nitroreductase family)
MPSDRLFHAMNGVHRSLLKLSGGRLGWRLRKMPVLELTTIGRKSGLARTVMLVAPLEVGDAIVVVASRGGDEQHPGWFVNLREHPEVKVTYAGRRETTMRARVANADERAALWPKVTAANPGYAGYQEKTAREIPGVFLEPAQADLA